VPKFSIKIVLFDWKDPEIEAVGCIVVSLMVGLNMPNDNDDDDVDDDDYDDDNILIAGMDL